MDICLQKSKISETPEHPVLRIDITGSQTWNINSTKLLIDVTCEDENGNHLFRVIRTTTSYTTIRLADAILKDLGVVLRIALTPKMPNKPTKKVVLYIHDFLAFAILTKQVQAPMDRNRQWINNARKIGREIGIPIEVMLGAPEVQRYFVKYTETVLENSAKLIPTPEMLGDVLRAWKKEQKQLRGWL